MWLILVVFNDTNSTTENIGCYGVNFVRNDAGRGVVESISSGLHLGGRLRRLTRM